VIANGWKLVEVAGEQELHAGKVQLGDLVQQADVDLRYLINPEHIARR